MKNSDIPDACSLSLREQNFSGYTHAVYRHSAETASCRQLGALYCFAELSGVIDLFYAAEQDLSCNRVDDDFRDALFRQRYADMEHFISDGDTRINRI